MKLEQAFSDFPFGSNVRINRPVAFCQSFNLPLEVPASTCEPSSELSDTSHRPSIEFNWLACPTSVRSSRPLATSHSLIAASSLLEATHRPFGENAIDLIILEWPLL